MDEKITPQKKARRKYENIHKQERKEATGQFNTRVPRPIFDEINAFLKEHSIPKIELIYAGYAALRKMVDEQEKNRMTDDDRHSD